MSEQYTVEQLNALMENVKEGLEMVQTFSNIGQLDYKLQLSVWNNETKQFDDVDMVTYTANKGNLRSLTAVLNIATTEFNPDRAKEYTRYVQVDAGEHRVKDDDGNWTSYKSNFEAILEPSLKELTGEPNGMAALAKLQGKYVDFRDVDANPSRRDPECQYRTPKLFNVFASREEAHQEYLNLTGGGGSAKSDNKANSDSGVWVPEGWAGSEQDFLDSIPFIKDDARPAPVVAKDYGIGVADVQKVKGM